MSQPHSAPPTIFLTFASFLTTIQQEASSLGDAPDTRELLYYIYMTWYPFQKLPQSKQLL